LLRIFEGLDGEVDVEVRPGEVSSVGPLDIQDIVHGRALEPREVCEAEEILLLVDEQP
jgi:hypothetical protein